MCALVKEGVCKGGSSAGQRLDARASTCTRGRRDTNGHSHNLLNFHKRGGLGLRFEDYVSFRIYGLGLTNEGLFFRISSGETKLEEFLWMVALCFFNLPA